MQWESMSVWACLEDISDCLNKFGAEGWQLGGTIMMKRQGKIADLNGAVAEKDGAILLLQRVKEIGTAAAATNVAIASM
jgi:hypothetical protein